MFYDNFVKFCVSVNKKPSAVALEIGISKSTVSNWKIRGTNPTDSTLQAIADYFGVTVDELMADKESKPTPEGELSEVRRRAVGIIRSMSDEQLKAFIAAAEAMNIK